MKVLVIGGSGAFGSLLCEMLKRDGVDVTVAGRSGGRGTVVLDRDGPLAGLAGYGVIVDAAGPFHAYGDDPYRVARAAIANGAHYFDLCDNADFCQGISALDGAARAAGVSVVSGMSSVPALSSTVVDALRDGQTPLMIESAILPGNKAPRGRSVVESILSQTGTDYVTRQAGKDHTVRSWSEPRRYDLGKGMRRQGWRIEVPDQRLFPKHFNCPNVTFRAGLELGVMRYGLAALSWLRSKLRFGVSGWLVSLVMLGAKTLAPFGSDRGGMSVEVTVPQGAGFVRKTWVMRAINGDGPYTPGIAVRAACRDLDTLPRGAFAALSVVSLAQVEACFEDLQIETDVTQTPTIPVFRQVLGPDLDRLPDAIKATHDAVVPRAFKGMASVTRGRGFQARVAAVLFGFPPSAEAVEVEVIKTPKGQGEIWLRRFGAKTFRSHLRARGRGMSERFGALTFDLGLSVEGEKLHFPVRAGRAFGVPIPRFLLPQSIATEAVVDERFEFDVHLKAPTGATLVHYRGWLEPV